MNVDVKNKLSDIDNIVKDSFQNQTCYFRGEPDTYESVSSSLRRNRKIVLPWYEGEHPEMKVRVIDSIKFDQPQRVSLSFSRNRFKYTKVKNLTFEVDIQNPDTLYEMAMIAGSFIEEQTKNVLSKETNLGILQHLGYPTPFLDFTKDVLVSLFFACNKLPDKDGRIIILGDNGTYKFKDMTKSEFPIAKKRAIAQKSVMLQKLELKETDDNYKECSIPCNLKPKILQYLENHNINAKSLFPDSWDAEKRYDSYKKFYQGVQAEIDGNAVDAIKLYTDTIELNTEFISAYKRRGRILYHMLNYKNALSDIRKACSLEKSYGFYDINKEDEIIDLHLFFNEHNAGCMHRILGKINEFYGDKHNSLEYMRKAEYIQHRWRRRKKNNESTKPTAYHK